MDVRLSAYEARDFDFASRLYLSANRKSRNLKGRIADSRTSLVRNEVGLFQVDRSGRVVAFRERWAVVSVRFLSSIRKDM
jgi:hypothetical protein